MATAWNLFSHYTYNNGYGERFEVKDPGFMRYDRIGLQKLIEDSYETGGAQILNDIRLRMHIRTNNQSYSYPYRAFYEVGFYCGMDLFMVTIGGGRDVADQVWACAKRHGKEHGLHTPFSNKPAGPLVVDVILPTTNPEVMAFLHSGDSKRLTRDLGRALLFPESIRI